MFWKLPPSAPVTITIIVDVYSIWCDVFDGAVQVLPRHRQSAAAAAEAMLNNPSPLSGLHKLALSICARKRSIPMQPLASVLAGGAAEGGGAAQGKENVTPALQWQQADASGTAYMCNADMPVDFPLMTVGLISVQSFRVTSSSVYKLVGLTPSVVRLLTPARQAYDTVPCWARCQELHSFAPKCWISKVPLDDYCQPNC